jgi:hypothetical protein
MNVKWLSKERRVRNEKREKWLSVEYGVWRVEWKREKWLSMRREGNMRVMRKWLSMR